MGYVNKSEYSPKYNPNKPSPVTGLEHNWVPFEGTYYGPAYKCSVCNRKNWGWNLWKEDFEPTCTGRPWTGGRHIDLSKELILVPTMLGELDD